MRSLNRSLSRKFLLLCTLLLLGALAACTTDSPYPPQTAANQPHCASYGCSLAPALGSIYCSLHKCSQFGCGLPKAFGSLYCALHAPKKYL